MVLIIDGEIVADDDPRAKAARAKRAAPSQRASAGRRARCHAARPTPMAPWLRRPPTRQWAGQETSQR